MKEAEDVLSKHNNQTDNINSWNIKDITKILRTYRVKEDKPIPTKKSAVVDLYHNWKQRPLTKYNGKVVVDMTDEDNVIVTEPELPGLPALVVTNQAATGVDRKVLLPLQSVVEAEASVVQQPNSVVPM